MGLLHRDDEPIDGSDLQPLDEPGSDELLSHEVRERIERIVRDYIDRKDRR